MAPDFEATRLAAVDLPDPDPAATVFAVVDLAVVDLTVVDFETVDLADDADFSAVDFSAVDFAADGRGAVDLAVVVDFLALLVDLLPVDLAAGGPVVDWAITAKAANRATGMELAISRKDPV